MNTYLQRDSPNLRLLSYRPFPKKSPCRTASRGHSPIQEFVDFQELHPSNYRTAGYRETGSLVNRAVKVKGANDSMGYFNIVPQLHNQISLVHVNIYSMIHQATGSMVHGFCLV